MFKRLKDRKERKSFASIVTRLKEIKAEADDLLWVLHDKPEFSEHLHAQVPLFAENLDHAFLSLLSSLSVSHKDWMNAKIREKLEEIDGKKASPEGS